MTKVELVAMLRDVSGPVVTEAVAAAMAAYTQTQAAGGWMERLMAGAARPAAPVEVAPADRGIACARYLRALGASKLRGTGIDGTMDVLKLWGYDDLAEKWTEGRAKALAAGDATSGGFLVPTQFSQEVIEFLRAMTVVRRLQARTIPLPTGTVKIPKLSGGATAYYVGENTNATKSQQTTGQLTLTFKKLITLVPMSNDLLRYSSPGADTIVRDDMVNAMRVREDQAFIRDTGTESSPKGLRYWANAANIISANGTVSVQNTFTDLGKLIQQLLEANIPMIAPGWIFAPRTEVYLKTLLNSNGWKVFADEMATGRLMGFPYATTTNVPTNLDVSGVGNNDESEIYLVDFAQVIIGEAMNLVVDASPEAAYHDGSSVVSAYSQDQTVVRAIAEHDLGLRYDKAIAVMTQVTWKPGSV